MDDTQIEKMITTARHCLAFELTGEETIQQVMLVWQCTRDVAMLTLAAAEIMERHSQ